MHLIDIFESWSKAYKRSIDCSHPKGFSQRAHCAGRKARQSGKKTSSKSVNESQQTDYTLIDAFRDFLPIAVKFLKLKELPKIHLVKELHDTHVPTFGRFQNESRVITVVIDKRNSVDILRTLAHELAHYAQGERGELDSESWHTGSDEENQAHEQAGIIMREFNKKFPQYLSSDPVMLEGDLDEAARKTPARNMPVNPEDLVVPLSDVPAKKPRGHKQYDPAKDFPGVSAFKKPNVAEGDLNESKNGNQRDAVPALKGALVNRKLKLKKMSDKLVYEKIDQIMRRVAMAYGITPEQLHNLWMKKYGELPDTWILDESKSHNTEWNEKVARHQRLRALAKRTKDEDQFNLHNAALAKLYGVDRLPVTPDSTFNDDPGGIAVGESKKKTETLTPEAAQELWVKNYGEQMAERVYYSIKEQMIWIVSDFTSLRRGACDTQDRMRAMSKSEFARWLLVHFTPALEAAGWPEVDSEGLAKVIKDEIREPLMQDQCILENFADGKVKGKSRPGRVKKAGASCQGSVTSLRQKAKKYGGERGKMYHWCANMKSGRNK